MGTVNLLSYVWNELSSDPPVFFSRSASLLVFGNVSFTIEKKIQEDRKDVSFKYYSMKFDRNF